MKKLGIRNISNVFKGIILQPHDAHDRSTKGEAKRKDGKVSN